jgi:hypothetical protein
MGTCSLKSNRELSEAYQGIQSRLSANLSSPLRLQAIRGLWALSDERGREGLSPELAAEIVGLVLKSTDLVSRQERWPGEQQSHL